LLLTFYASAQQPLTLSPTVQKYTRVSTPRVILEHVRIIDGTGQAPADDQNVTIEHGKITAVAAGGDAPAAEGTTILNLRGYTAMPGIVGMHNHLFYVARPNEDSEWHFEPPVLVPQMTFSAPRLYLAGGVTTMRTTGSVETYTDLNLKRAIDDGKLPGPHMDVTGPYLEGPDSYFIGPDQLAWLKRALLNSMIGINKLLTRSHPRVKLSRALLPGVHRAFGGQLVALITGGAFMEPSTMQFFYDLGIPVVNGYGLTEAGTALTLNDLKPFRADTVGKPLPGVELRILNPDEDGIGQVAAHSKTVMSHYLDDPELTLETIVDGWLLTGDLGRFDGTGHLQLFGRQKNMIVTEGGKNIYPEDIENAFDGLPVKEYCIFAANYVWPKKALGKDKEMLVLVLRLEQNQRFDAKLLEEISARNRKLPDFKRVGGYLIWERDFPRTASMKIKRQELAADIAESVERSAVVGL